MAAGLGFKDFTTGEVLTAADVDGYLMQGVWVFASAAARDAAVTSPQEGNFAYLKDTNVTTYYTGSAWANLDTTGMTNPMTTTGDTIYSSSGSTPARLGIGSTGQVLTVAGGVPTWATPAGGGGKVLQVVSTSYTTEKTISSSTYTDTDLTLSITPTLSTSKILVLASQGIKLNGTSNNFSLGYAQLLRGSTALLTDFTAVIQSGTNVNGQTGVQMYIGASYLDSPATTSSTTYKTQIKTGSGVSAVVAQYNTTPSTLTLMEIGA